MHETSQPEPTRTLVADDDDLLPATFIASAVEAAAGRGANVPDAEEIARADVDAAAPAVLRAQASPDSPARVAAPGRDWSGGGPGAPARQ